MNRRLALIGVAGGAIALTLAVFAFLQFGPIARSDVAVSSVTSPAEARALGARWRANRSDELGQAYAQALVNAGLYDQLLTEIAERGLFAGDPQTASLYRAEANLMQGRFEEALSTAGASAENPYFAFARARAAYALTGAAGDRLKDLSVALRGPEALAAEAWLFRARIALDANDLESAEASATRASEAGADALRTELVRIESAVRAGELAAAAQLLADRGKRMRAAADPDAYRLAAMIKLRLGEANEAARLMDLARIGAGAAGRGRLLAALAKREAGDNAQASALVSAHLASAPRDWAALDLAAAIARDMGRQDEAEGLLIRLAKERPALAIVRAMAAGGASPDETFDRLKMIDREQGVSGAAETLLGEGAPLRGIEKAGERDRLIIDLAAAINKGDARQMRLAARSASAADASPLELALAGAASARLNDFDEAIRCLMRASESAPDFLAPVLIRADLLAANGAGNEAVKVLSDYLARNKDNNRARLALARLEAADGDFAAAAASFASVDPAIVFATVSDAELYGAAAKSAGGALLSAMLKSARSFAPSARILAASLSAAGDDAGAAAAYRKAVIADPGDMDLRDGYLETMTRLGRGAEATSLLEQVDRKGTGGAAGLWASDAGGESRIFPENGVNIRQ